MTQAFLTSESYVPICITMDLQYPDFNKKTKDNFLHKLIFTIRTEDIQNLLFFNNRKMSIFTAKIPFNDASSLFETIKLIDKEDYPITGTQQDLKNFIKQFKVIDIYGSMQYFSDGFDNPKINKKDSSIVLQRRPYCEIKIKYPDVGIDQTICYEGTLKECFDHLMSQYKPDDETEDNLEELWDMARMLGLFVYTAKGCLISVTKRYFKLVNEVDLSDYLEWKIEE
jgi:hypothetical protein